MSKKHNLRIKSESGFKVEEIELLEVATIYFLKELDKIRKIDSISGEILIVDNILSEAANEPLSGDMMELKNHCVDNRLHNSYYVCRLADYINSAETVRTLAHELVHVWQTASGVLRTTDDGEWFWQGKSYGKSPYQGTDDDLLLPWEREADILDVKLSRQFYSKYFSKW